MPHCSSLPLIAADDQAAGAERARVLCAEEKGRRPPGAARQVAACSGSGCSRAEWQEGGGSQPYLGARAPDTGPVT